MFKQCYCFEPLFRIGHTLSYPSTSASTGLEAVTHIVTPFLERKQSGIYSLKAKCAHHLLLLSEVGSARFNGVCISFL